MDIVSHYFIPDSVFFTIKVESQDFTESKVVFETLTKGLEQVAKDIFGGEMKTAESTFKRKIVVADESTLVTEFGSAKEMLLYYTGTYDRNLHYSAYKHFINSHLLNGRKPVEHIWRITTTGEQIEI